MRNLDNDYRVEKLLYFTLKYKKGKDKINH